MRKAPPSLGYHEVDYQFLAILRKSHAAFLQARQRESELAKAPAVAPAATQQLFHATADTKQQGVISVIMAVSYLEATIHNYGTHFIHFKTYEEHLDCLGLVSKWMVVPMLAQGIEIKEDSRELNELKELVKARNCIIHSKIKWMTDDGLKNMNDEKEIRRFRKAAEKALGTVTGLIQIIEAHQQKVRHQLRRG